MCDRCKGWVHLGCSDLEATEYGFLARIHSTSVKWFCPTCTREFHASPDHDNHMATQDALMDTLMQVVVKM